MLCAVLNPQEGRRILSKRRSGQRQEGNGRDGGQQGLQQARQGIGSTAGGGWRRRGRGRVGGRCSWLLGGRGGGRLCTANSTQKGKGWQ